MQDTTSMIIQQSDRQRTKMDGPEPIVLWDQANGLTSQGLAEIDSVPFPLDLSIGTHFADCHSDLVLRYADSTRIGPKRRSVMTGRRLLFQRLVWPLLVVSPAKGVKGTLLDVPVRSRRSGRLRLQRPMQSLKSSVLLRVAGFDPLRYDAQLDPPYRQRRQAPQSNTGEGRPVVGPDGPRKSVLPKGSLQNPLCLRTVGSSTAHRRPTGTERRRPARSEGRSGHHLLCGTTPSSRWTRCRWGARQQRRVRSRAKHAGVVFAASPALPFPGYSRRCWAPATTPLVPTLAALPPAS